ncbi:MAG TPA: hypothetical protein VER11_18200 [Polyangiaceae bacterium]|nr:hypothetical protein [Polyangiaceae bacterium]
MKFELSTALLLGFALGTSACNSERSQRVAASYSSAAERTERPFPTTHRRQEPPTGIEAVPTEEDYEARAASSITETNLKEKLAELEQELRL